MPIARNSGSPPSVSLQGGASSMMFKPCSNKERADRSAEKQQLLHNIRALAILTSARTRLFATARIHAASTNRYLLATARRIQACHLSTAVKLGIEQFRRGTFSRSSCAQIHWRMDTLMSWQRTFESLNKRPQRFATPPATI